jgi:Flp pilus assembly protein TadG
MTSIRMRGRLKQFVSNRSGNVAVAFALTILPVLFLVGAAIDYSGATDLKTRLQRATDATALQLCQMSRTASQGQRQQAALTALTGYMGKAPVSIDTLTVNTSPYQTYIVTRSTYTTAVVTLMGQQFRTIDVTADAQCQAEQQTFEIALVLDNTGSMASSSGSQSKIDALKAAATNFVNFVYSTPALSQTKISIVPFAAAVAVDPTAYRSASWIDQSGKASYHWNIVQKGAASTIQGAGIQNRLAALTLLKSSVPSWDWTGCLESLPYPYNVQDGAPVSGQPDSYYVPMLAPDESGNGGQSSHSSSDPNFSGTISSSNSYIDDSGSSCSSITTEAVVPSAQPPTETRTNRYCKYQAMQNASTSGGRGPNFSCTTRPLTRLTDDKTLLLNQISQLQASGNTNIHEGFMWGWRTLSPNSVFAADAAAYGKAYNNKIVILMTDGANTWDANASNPLGSKYSAYGFYKNPDGSTAMSPTTRLVTGTSVPTTGGQARNAMDALTLAACKNAAASPSKLQIYTIGFSVPSDPIDQQGLTLLQNCAGSTDRAFVANDSNALVSVFQQIANSIGSLRLTQ